MTPSVIQRIKRLTIARVAHAELAELTCPQFLYQSLCLELPRFGGQVTARATGGIGMSHFVSCRRCVIQSGMPAVRVVRPLDEFECRATGLVPRVEGVAVQQLTFERGEEALALGLVSRRPAGLTPTRCTAPGCATTTWPEPRSEVARFRRACRCHHSQHPGTAHQ